MEMTPVWEESCDGRGWMAIPEGKKKKDIRNYSSEMISVHDIC